ncbi:CLUMA_CG013062, isoform A [Clunio marinus]|uniref:CLUMA_CG013062, isoform A n=1 Tax=Clunio marinus TaxID=568069 RepID=A0A1J1IJ35_9DIPT|nr:CLUMA_CG013062, isoform A [Clunio marinus]
MLGMHVFTSNKYGTRPKRLQKLYFTYTSLLSPNSNLCSDFAMISAQILDLVHILITLDGVKLRLTQALECRPLSMIAFRTSFVMKKM